MDNIFSSSREKFENDKLELQKEINILKKENDNLVKHLENLEEQIQPLGGQTSINKKCTFIKILQYIESSSYKGQANERFVLFAKFQSFSPILLRISEDKNIKFERMPIMK